jgi:lysophospholipase L1-like esterase
MEQPSTSQLCLPSRFLRNIRLVIATILASSSAILAESRAPFGDAIQVRGVLNNSRLRFERDKTGNVAFLGGSITEMQGYRPLVYEILKKRFPDTAFTFTNAGIGSTCSTTGAFRLNRDVLQHGPVDLLFVEFAVNDDQDGHFNRAECIRGMEGIVRHARLQNPNVDIVMTFFVNERMIKSLQKGEQPVSIAAHEAVAADYQIPTVNVARELTDEITAGTMTYERYGGVHPGPVGQTLCAQMISELLGRFWSAPLPVSAQASAQVLPTKPMDPLSYFSGRFLDVRQAKVLSGWTIETPDWERLPGRKAPRLVKIPMLCATKPGAELTVDFEGTSIGAFIVSGPDAGVVDVSVDGEQVRSFNLFTGYSGGLHYPWTVMLGNSLKPGKHRMNLRISEKTAKTGHAMRIMEFCAN